MACDLTIMTTLSLKNLTCRFGDVVAVDGIDLDVGDRELVSLLGPSGCGKTTTLRCIAGFESPDSGDILFDQVSVAGLPPEKRNLGMVFQNYALFPHMTVSGNLAYGLQMRKTPQQEIDRRIGETLEIVQLAGLEDRYPNQLSGGQQQRVALARALIIEPRVLLLDEPLANLDAKLREEMRFFIRNLQKDLGITTIYVTHDQAEAMVMSDRIVVMFNGRIHQIGRPAEIYNFPATQDIADFIGLSNFIACTVTGRENNDQYIVDTPAGTLRSTTNASHTVSSKVIMMVRPEVITLHTGSAEGAHNEITGTVAEKYYLGNVITYRIRYTDDAILQVQGQPWSKFEVGDPIWCRFDVERSWILPTDSG
jgi:spermidine/putrescine ABC transporter ATP-binding subunit